MKSKQKKSENARPGLEIRDKKPLIDELMEELNPEEDEFSLDGVHFKLSSCEATSEPNDTTGTSLTLLSKQINDIHKLTFSEDKELTANDLKDKMKAQILSQTGKKSK